MVVSEKTIPEETLAQMLSRVRKEHGFSQDALADALGLTRQAVSKWERGAAYPSVENLIKLSRLYGVDLAVLTGGAATPPAGADSAPTAEAEQSAPVRRLDRKRILRPLCLLAACAVICVTVLLLRVQPQNPNRQDAVPISEMESKEFDWTAVESDFEPQSWSWEGE